MEISVTRTSGFIRRSASTASRPFPTAHFHKISVQVQVNLFEHGWVIVRDENPSLGNLSSLVDNGRAQPPQVKSLMQNEAGDNWRNRQEESLMPSGRRRMHFALRHCPRSAERWQ